MTKKILIAPLNWGLGHATRCIPIIRTLEKLGASVYLASDGSALRLLKAEFPHLPAFTLPSYRIRYQTKSMVWNIAKQLPRIVLAIRTEQWATERLVREHGIQGIISDNRYGCFSRQTRNVMLTHQIHLKVPNAALQWGANRVLHFALDKFDDIWIPDEEAEPNLAGELSHPSLAGMKTYYVGLLSRFSHQNKAPNANLDGKELPKRLQIAVILSGPEPQRSYLEQLLLEQALALPHKFVFVKGKTEVKEHQFVAAHVEVVSYLTSSELNELIRESDLVVCRSGYSSLMDLAVYSDKKALLIPTPGQTEQEYLGHKLARQGAFVCQSQDKIDLESALRQIEATNGFNDKPFDTEVYQEILKNWVEQV